MVVPVRQQAAQQVRPAQEGRVGARGGAENEVITPAGPGVAPVQHELLGGETAFPCGVVEMRRPLDELIPARRRVNVHLDHARVRRHSKTVQARILGRLVTLENHRLRQRPRRGFDRCDDFEIALESLGGRHEDVEHSVARLCTHGRARDRDGGFVQTRLDGLRAIHSARRLADFREFREWGKGLRRVRRRDVGAVPGRDPRQGLERQAISDRRVARNQVATLAAQEPRSGLPLRSGRVAADWQDVADGAIQAALQGPGETLPFAGIFEPGFGGVDVRRQLSLAPRVIEVVLVRAEDEPGWQAEVGCDRGEEALRIHFRRAVVCLLVGDESRVLPHRFAVAAPEAVQRPARQRLSRVPLALAEVGQAVGGVFLTHTMIELRSEPALVRAEGGSIPFSPVGILERDEGGFSAHRQANVRRREMFIDQISEALDLGPLLVRVRLGDAGRFPDALDLHAVHELRRAILHGS